jgi:hypothetical protein
VPFGQSRCELWVSQNGFPPCALADHVHVS